MVPFLLAYLVDRQPPVLWALVIWLVIVLNVIEGFRGWKVARTRDGKL